MGTSVRKIGVVYANELNRRLLNNEKLDKDQLAQLESYKKRNKAPDTKALKDYREKVKSNDIVMANIIKFPDLKDLFLERYENNYQKYDYSGEYLENIKTLLYYFSEDPRFFKSPNLIKTMNNPSFDKGLLVIGLYGNGKSSSLRVLSEIMNGTKNAFLFRICSDVVTEYNSLNTKKENEEKFFWKKMCSGQKLFDDILSELDGKNYGKVNIFNEVIFKREEQRVKTHFTCNFLKNYNSNKSVDWNVEQVMIKFGEKYDDKILDRMLGMVNIIVFNGKSFRR